MPGIPAISSCLFLYPFKFFEVDVQKLTANPWSMAYCRGQSLKNKSTVPWLLGPG